jgi:threonine dehydrogenase-like Zn-dependent dehydrogenase
MKAVAVFPGERDVRVVDHEAPRLSARSEVKLRMLEVGVCGTDREICASQYGTPPAGSDYLIIGHESLGEVVEVGAAVSRMKAGDLVVPMVRPPARTKTAGLAAPGARTFALPETSKSAASKNVTAS